MRGIFANNQTRFSKYDHRGRALDRKRKNRCSAVLGSNGDLRRTLRYAGDHAAGSNRSYIDIIGCIGKQCLLAVQKRIDINGLAYADNFARTGKVNNFFGLAFGSRSCENIFILNDFRLHRRGLDDGFFHFGLYRRRLGRRGLDRRRLYDGLFHFRLDGRRLDRRGLDDGFFHFRLDGRRLGRRGLDDGFFHFGLYGRRLGRRGLDDGFFHFGFYRRGLGRRGLDDGLFRFGLYGRRLDDGLFSFGRFSKRNLENVNGICIFIVMGCRDICLFILGFEFADFFAAHRTESGCRNVYFHNAVIGSDGNLDSVNAAAGIAARYRVNNALGKIRIYFIVIFRFVYARIVLGKIRISVGERELFTGHLRIVIRGSLFFGFLVFFLLRFLRYGFLLGRFFSCRLFRRLFRCSFIC